MGKISKALERAEEERLKHLEAIRNASSITPERSSESETGNGLLEFPTRVESSHEGLVAVMEPPEAPSMKVIPETAIDERVVTLFDPRSPVSEQYRILRTNLLSLRPGKPMKVVMLSSAVHSEGKTVSAVNLAVTMANDTHQRRVLLIDADLRAGTVHRLFGDGQKLGLSDCLAKGVPWQEVLVGTPIANLMILPRGATPPYPAELLASGKMRQLMAEVRAAFDFCILDSPPVVPLTDPSILGGLTDGVVLVVRGGKTQRTMVQYAISLLAQARVPTLGCILTHMETHVPEYIYRY